MLNDKIRNLEINEEIQIAERCNLIDGLKKEDLETSLIMLKQINGNLLTRDNKSVEILRESESFRLDRAYSIPNWANAVLYHLHFENKGPTCFDGEWYNAVKYYEIRK